MAKRKAHFVGTDDCRVGLDKNWILLNRPNWEVEDSLYRPKMSGWDYSTHLAFAEYVRSFPSAVEYMQAVCK